jgi:uncharacterized protein (DUF2236 family)
MIETGSLGSIDSKERPRRDATPLGPDSMLQGYSNQLRVLLALSRAGILEAAHPQIGAALISSSTFVAHPWRRLYNTLGALRRATSDDATVRQREADRISRLHGRISGTDDEGRPFDAMDAEVRAWVIATLFESTLFMCRLGGDPLGADGEEQLYQDFRSLFVTLGDDGTHLPDTLEAFWPYYNDMIDKGLEDTDAVKIILYRLFDEIPPPPFLRGQNALWAALRAAAAPLANVVMIASLPESYRRQAYLRPVPGSRVLMHTVYLSAGVATRVLSPILSQANALLRALAPVNDTDPGARMLDAARAGAGLFGSVLRRVTPSALRSDPDVAAGDAHRSAEQFFSEVLDQTGDGRVGWPDIAAMAREIASRLDLDAAPENKLYEAYASWWKELTSLDADGDGRVTREEYATAAPTMAGPGLIAVADVLFDAVDVDDDQVISQDEYRALFHRAFNMEQTGGDGQLDRSDFIREFLDFMAGRHSAAYQGLLVDA